MSKFDLVCLGGASYDIILKTPRLPRPDEKLVVEYAGRQAGGLVANTACAAARLGLRAAWAGKVGADEGGHLVRNAFIEFGVHIDLLELDEGMTSDFTVILLEPSGERTILVVPTTPLPPGISAASLAEAAQAHIVYSVPHAPGWFVPIAQAVHTNGGRVAVDLEGSSPTRGEDLLQDLRACDLLFSNQRGLALAAGESDPPVPLAPPVSLASQEAWIVTHATRLLDLGIKLVCVTLGARGAWAFTSHEQVYSPTFEVPVVDTTGAGDCFHAAFMKACLVDSRPLSEALRFANAAAALSVQKLGARGGLPTQAEVEAFLVGQPAGSSPDLRDRREIHQADSRGEEGTPRSP